MLCNAYQLNGDTLPWVLLVESVCDEVVVKQLQFQKAFIWEEPDITSQSSSPLTLLFASVLLLKYHQCINGTSCCDHLAFAHFLICFLTNTKCKVPHQQDKNEHKNFRKTLSWKLNKLKLYIIYHVSQQDYMPSELFQSESHAKNQVCMFSSQTGIERHMSSSDIETNCFSCYVELTFSSHCRDKE